MQFCWPRHNDEGLLGSCCWSYICPQLKIFDFRRSGWRGRQLSITQSKSSWRAQHRRWAGILPWQSWECHYPWWCIRRWWSQLWWYGPWWFQWYVWIENLIPFNTVLLLPTGDVSFIHPTPPFFQCSTTDKHFSKAHTTYSSYNTCCCWALLVNLTSSLL